MGSVLAASGLRLPADLYFDAQHFGSGYKQAFLCSYVEQKHAKDFAANFKPPKALGARFAQEFCASEACVPESYKALVEAPLAASAAQGRAKRELSAAAGVGLARNARFRAGAPEDFARVAKADPHFGVGLADRLAQAFVAVSNDALNNSGSPVDGYAKRAQVIDDPIFGLGLPEKIAVLAAVTPQALTSLDPENKALRSCFAGYDPSVLPENRFEDLQAGDYEASYLLGALCGLKMRRPEYGEKGGGEALVDFLDKICAGYAGQAKDAFEKSFFENLPPSYGDRLLENGQLRARYERVKLGSCVAEAPAPGKGVLRV